MNDHPLLGQLMELETATKALQASLLARDTQGIWSNLAEQERSVEQLDRLRRESTDGLESETTGNPHIRQLLQRNQAMMRTNRALIQRFLDVFDQTLARLGGGRSAIYAANGTSAACRTALFVSQQG